MDKATDVRLPAFIATDVILATLQAAFSQSNLIDGKNPYLFVPADPAMSKVWVCHPEGRLDVRDGNRMLVTVIRGEYQPQELGLANRMGQSFSDASQDTSDLAQTPVQVSCEAGNMTDSETLASIVYGVIKHFRLQLMAEYDIFSIKLNGISAPFHQGDGAGKPWITTVSLRLFTQEQARMTELGNALNTVVIAERLADNKRRTIVSLDATPS